MAEVPYISQSVSVFDKVEQKVESGATLRVAVVYMLLGNCYGP